MADISYKVEWEGNFDFKHFYGMVHDWFKSNKWESINGDDNADKSEILYRQNVFAGGVTEHHIWWRLKKNPDIGDEFEYVLNININSSGMTKQEIIYKGKKIKADNGSLTVEVECSLKFKPEDDPKEKWEKKGTLWKTLLPLYIILKKGQKDTAMGLMISEMYNLQAHIKRYLNMRQFMEAEEAELFHPSKEYS